MKRPFPFLIFLAALAVLGGWLLSHITFLGRMGINLMHKDLKFLKVWWKDSLLLFGVWIVLFGLQGLAAKRLPRKSSWLVQLICLLVAAAGLYFTYADFRADISHRLLGERFHLGAYTFWLGWMAISIYYLRFTGRDSRVTTLQ